MKDPRGAWTCGSSALADVGALRQRGEHAAGWETRGSAALRERRRGRLERNLMAGR
jgi:hypothetical protein